MAIAHTGTTLPHALSYRLTYNDGIAHGTACAFFLADFVEQAPKGYQEILSCLLQLDNIGQLRQLVDNLCDFSSIQAETVDLSINEVSSNPAKMKTCPFTFSFHNTN